VLLVLFRMTEDYYSLSVRLVFTRDATQSAGYEIARCLSVCQSVRL